VDPDQHLWRWLSFGCNRKNDAIKSSLQLRQVLASFDSYLQIRMPLIVLGDFLQNAAMAFPLAQQSAQKENEVVFCREFPATRYGVRKCWFTYPKLSGSLSQLIALLYGKFHWAAIGSIAASDDAVIGLGLDLMDSGNSIQSSTNSLVFLRDKLDLWFPQWRWCSTHSRTQPSLNAGTSVSQSTHTIPPMPRK